MRLPKSIKIGVHNYALKKTKSLKRDFGDGDKWLYGYVDHAKPYIEVEKELAEVVQFIAVLHESMHAMAHQGGQHDVDAVIEERLIQVWSHGIVSLFQNNPKLLLILNDLCGE